MNDSKILFFFGAGASVPAGIKGVVGLAEDFRKWLEDTSKSTNYRGSYIDPSPLIIGVHISQVTNH
jgi:hypothetical protein